mmetsp:Transcript_24279/g.51757  ORF Transcript_24279/g.51757 Transcript_24279/m.51757 type:complete len:292 (-) Transcript_24279:484-1359(-)
MSRNGGCAVLEMIVGGDTGTASVAGILDLVTVTGSGTEIAIVSAGTAAGGIGTGTATGRRTKPSLRLGRKNVRSESSVIGRPRSARRGKSGSASVSGNGSWSGSGKLSVKSGSAPTVMCNAVIATGAETEARIGTEIAIVTATGKGPRIVTSLQIVTGGIADAEIHGIGDVMTVTGTERATSGTTDATTRTVIGTGTTEGMTATGRTGMIEKRHHPRMRASVILGIFQRRPFQLLLWLPIPSLLLVILGSLLVRFPLHLHQISPPFINPEATKVTPSLRLLILPRANLRHR